jgi:hypothetical protein
MTFAMSVVFLILFFVAIIVWAIVHSIRAERKRREAMQGACELMGFRYTAQPSKDFHHRFPPFSLMSQGGSRKSLYLMEGKIGPWEVQVFDFQYVVSTGKSSHTVSQTVVVLPAGGEGLPEFSLCPENLFHRIGKWFGYQDIDIEDHEAFSRAYLLRGTHPEPIRQVFTTELLNLLASQPHWTIECKGDQFIAYKSQKRVEPEKLPEFVADVLRIRDGFATPTS